MVKGAVRTRLAAVFCTLATVFLGPPGRAAVAPAAQDKPELWGGAKVGDDLAALQHRFPRAARPARPEVLSGGEIEALHLPLTSLAGAPAEALFFLRDGVLAAVQLRAAALVSGATRANLAFAYAVAREITRGVGPGYDCGESTVAGVAQYRCRWVKGEVTVREYYLDVAGQAPVFYVAYRRADDPAFDL